MNESESRRQMDPLGRDDGPAILYDSSTALDSCLSSLQDFVQPLPLSASEVS